MIQVLLVLFVSLSMVVLFAVEIAMIVNYIVTNTPASVIHKILVLNPVLLIVVMVM